MRAVGCQPTGVPEFSMGPAAPLMFYEAVGCQFQSSGWAPLMSYEGCRLPTYRGSRVQDGPHWCPIKAVGCQPTGVPEFLMGPAAPLMFYEAVGCKFQSSGWAPLMSYEGCSGWAPLMYYKGCRLPTYRGSRVFDGPRGPIDVLWSCRLPVPEFRMGIIDVLWRL